MSLIRNILEARRERLETRRVMRKLYNHDRHPVEDWVSMVFGAVVLTFIISLVLMIIVHLI